MRIQTDLATQKAASPAGEAAVHSSPCHPQSTGTSFISMALSSGNAYRPPLSYGTPLARGACEFLLVKANTTSVVMYGIIL